MELLNFKTFVAYLIVHEFKSITSFFLTEKDTADVTSKKSIWSKEMTA